jgi:hypothetical protein
MNYIFLDCDGVLADFDSVAVQVFGHDPRTAENILGTEEFWKQLKSHDNFYRDLPLIQDAMHLYQAIAHLNPILLTGCPAGGWAEAQKVAWAAHHFPNAEIITCRSKNKCRFIKRPGDILVDDYLKYRELWEAAGGIFIPHTSSHESIRQLAGLGVEVR